MFIPWDVPDEGKEALKYEWVYMRRKGENKQKKGYSFSVLLVTETPSNCYLMVNQP